MRPKSRSKTSWDVPRGAEHGRSIISLSRSKSPTAPVARFPDGDSCRISGAAQQTVQRSCVATTCDGCACCRGAHRGPWRTPRTPRRASRCRTSCRRVAPRTAASACGTTAAECPRADRSRAARCAGVCTAATGDTQRRHSSGRVVVVATTTAVAVNECSRSAGRKEGRKEGRRGR